MLVGIVTWSVFDCTRKLLSSHNITDIMHAPVHSCYQRYQVHDDLVVPLQTTHNEV